MRQTRWLALFAALLAVGAGCSSDPLEPPALADGGLSFFDARGLPDGTVITDAGAPLPDAVVLDENGEVCRTGRVASTLCSPNGAALAAATVSAETRDCTGAATVVSTTTDGRGAFRLDDLRAGPTTVRVQSGRFTAQFQVEVRAGAQVTLSPTGSSKVCLSPDAARLAVITGDYDRIEDLLDDLGFEYDLYCGDRLSHRPARALLSDREQLSAYDVLFVNCASGIDLRATNPEVELIRENLRAFVANGGSIYASDLSADFVAAVWPEAAQFTMRTAPEVEAPACCVCVDCPEACRLDPPVEGGRCPDPSELPPDCRQGGGVIGNGDVQQFVARVVDEDLAELVGDAALPVSFPLSGWVEVEGLGRDAEVLVGAGDRVLMFAFEPEPEGGRVVFTSFHNHQQAEAPIRALLSALVFQL